MAESSVIFTFMEVFMKIKRPSDTLIACLIDTFAAGLAAHAAYFFGNLSFHDDVVCTYDVGATHIFGRFTLGLLGKLTRLPFGGSNYSLPWFGGFVSLLFLALSSYLMIRTLNITSRLLRFLLCASLAVFPVLTATFAYGFTAPYYMLAFFLACFSACLLADHTSIRSLFAGLFLCALMIGIYQAYLPVMLSLEVLILLVHEFQKKEKPFRFWTHCLAGTVLGFAAYLVLMKASLLLTGKELYAYRGLNSMGRGHFSYLQRIFMACRMFFAPESFLPYRGSDDYLLFMWSMAFVYRALILLILLMAAAAFPKLSGASRLRFAFLLLLFPLCANFIFVMTDFDVYSLMLYGEVMIFALGILLAEHAEFPAPFRTGLRTVVCAVLLYSVVFYIRYDNLCYYKAGRMQEEAISYDTALITRIQSIDGYDPSLPVCFVHGLEKDTSFLASDPELEKVTLTPYGGSEIINDYSYVDFLRIHCGYAPSVIEDSGQYDAYLEQEEVPRYPLSGSIRIVDDVIVVNF